MYKVLYQPELQQRLPNAPKSAFICLVFDGPKGRLRDLLYSVSTDLVLRREHVEKFELAATLLNQPPSLSVQKMRLRSIVAVWQVARFTTQQQTRHANFRADFGRMDIGLNPGWGRD